METEYKLEFEQHLAEAKSRVKRILQNRALTDAELNYILDVVDSSIRIWKVESEIKIPKKSPSLNSINCVEDKVVGYHYVNGVKRHLLQITKGQQVIYFTDGVKETVF